MEMKESQKINKHLDIAREMNKIRGTCYQLRIMHLERLLNAWIAQSAGGVEYTVCFSAEG